MTTYTPKLENKFDSIVAEMRKIITAKHDLRGSKNISEQGLMGVVNRIVLDKGSRVRNEVELQEAVRIVRKKIPDLSLPEGPGNQDTLEDDLLDMANYCIIALLLLRNQWE